MDETLADVVFLVEDSAANGAYINELKTNYIVPTLEHFSQGPIEDREYLISERFSTQYCVVLYRNTANLLEPMCTTFGPYASPQKVLDLFERLPLTGGGMESCANLGEGFATTHACFDDMKEHRTRFSMDVNLNTQKHCILMCNSPPYSMPVIECWKYSGKTVEQLAALFHERKINLSIIAPRKIPILFKIYMKADGDQPTAAKNYAKNIRHLVLLKGYHLKERPQSPNSTVNVMTNQPNQVGLSSQAQQQQQQQQSNLQQQNTQMPMENSHVPMQQQQQQQSIQQQQVAQMTGMNPNQQTVNTLSQQMLQQQFANQNPQNPMQNPNFQGQGNRWVFNPNQQQQSQVRPPFMGGPNGPGGPMGAVNQGMPGQNPNSALISQLSAPPNQNVNPMMQQQQQQQQIRMQMQQQLQQQLQQQQNVMNPNMAAPGPSGQQVSVPNAQQPNTSMGGQPNPSTSSEQAIMRDKIWSGTLEWVEKSKPDQQKISRQLQCIVTANIKDGEPEIKAVNWPSKLLMQLMPKHLVGNIGGQFLKDSKMVVFKPQPCEALDSLAKNMTTIFAGCVHFTTPANTPPCDIKVLILLYTAEKNAYLGFIPNNQSMFVERLRKVIQQKQSMGLQQTAAGAGGAPNTMQQQQNQQQLQNPMVGQIPNALSGNSMNPQQQQQQDPNQQQQHQFNQYNPQQQQMSMQMGGGSMNQQMMGGPPLAGGPEQMVGNSPMQQQMSMMQHQRMPMMSGGNPNNPQQQMPPQQQMQQRMVRPMMNNNPGLRHLLQQQSTPGQQFRPQMGGPGVVPGMGGMPNPNQMTGGPSGGPNRQFDDSNFDFM